MGMFDTVRFTCPSCSGDIEAQSKAGRRVLASYSESQVPVVIAHDMDNTTEHCPNCGAEVRLKILAPIRAVPMTAELAGGDV